MITLVVITSDQAILANVVLGSGKLLLSRSLYNRKATVVKGRQVLLIYGSDVAISVSVGENLSFCEDGTLNASIIADKILLCNKDGIHNIAPLV